MNKDDILDQYGVYARAYLRFLEDKRKEIESSMSRLQRQTLPEDVLTPEQLVEEMMAERPVWDVVPADEVERSAVSSELSEQNIGINVPIPPSSTPQSEPDVAAG